MPILHPRPSCVLYILRDELVFYDSAHTVYRLDLPIEVVDMLEVQDVRKYISGITTFIQNNQLAKQRALLVLGEGITFRKKLQLDTNQAYQNDIDDFSGKLPIEAAKQHIVVVQRKDTVVMYGVNRDLFEAPLSALTQCGFKVVACVPAIEYDIKAGHSLDQTALNFFYSKFKAPGAYDFLSSK